MKRRLEGGAQVEERGAAAFGLGGGGEKSGLSLGAW